MLLEANQLMPEHDRHAVLLCGFDEAAQECRAAHAVHGVPCQLLQVHPIPRELALVDMTRVMRAFGLFPWARGARADDAVRAVERALAAWGTLVRAVLAWGLLTR